MIGIRQYMHNPYTKIDLKFKPNENTSYMWFCFCNPIFAKAAKREGPYYRTDCCYLDPSAPDSAPFLSALVLPLIVYTRILI